MHVKSFEMDMLVGLSMDDMDINMLVKSFEKYEYKLMHVKLFIL